MPHASLQSDLMNMGRTAHSLGGSIDDILPSRKGSGGLRHFRLTTELYEDATT